VKICKSSPISLLSAAALLLHGLAIPLPAQDAGPLKVTVLTGEGVSNSPKQHTPQTLSVRVDNAAGHPVSAAVVVFTAPAYGAGGRFLDDMKALRVTTDEHGVANGSGFHSNGVPGPFVIDVKAVYGTQTGVAAIQQSNIESSSGISKKTWWIIGAIAVAGAAGGAAAMHGGSSSSSTSISPGGATVGAPK
jgi:hypothetical protein